MEVEVGQIVNTHGIKGEVKVKSNSDFTETRFQPGEQLLVKHNNTEIVYTVASYRIHKGFHMLRFEGINNINDIEHLKGDYIYQERDHQDIELGEHEYYYSDIIGCTVFKDDDTPIGRVINIFETGANDVMVVRATADSIDAEERMIPWHKDVVQRVDLEAGRIYVNWGVDY